MFIFIYKTWDLPWVSCRVLYSYTSVWSLPLPNVTWYSGTWPYTMTPSIDQTLHQFADLLPNWTLLPILTLLPNFGGFHRTLQRVRLAKRGRFLLRTPGPVPFGTCICSKVETILFWTCHVYGPPTISWYFSTLRLGWLLVLKLVSKWRFIYKFVHVGSRWICNPPPP